MEFNISNADIAEAIRNRETYIVPVKGMTYNNAIIFAGTIPESLISNMLRIPKIAYNNNFRSFSRLLSINAWSKVSVGFSTNDIRLFPVIEDFFNGMGMPVQWLDATTLPINTGIYLNFTFPYSTNNPKLFYTKIMEFVNAYFHLKIEHKTSEAKCNRKCEEDFGSSGKLWYFPKMCKTHIWKLTEESLKKLVNNEDDSKLELLTDRTNNPYNHMMKSVMNNYRNFKSHIKTVDRCLLCHDKAPTQSFTFLTNVLCDNCFNKISWNNFEIDYKNKLVEWEDLFENKEKLKKYTKEKELI